MFLVRLSRTKHGHVYFLVGVSALFFALSVYSRVHRDASEPPPVPDAVRAAAAATGDAVVMCRVASFTTGGSVRLTGLDGAERGAHPVVRGWAVLRVPPGSGGGMLRADDIDGAVRVRWTEVATEGRCDDFGTVLVEE